MRWSQPRHFDYNSINTYAPREAGVYEIGFYREETNSNGVVSRKFTPLYLGRALGRTTTIRSRLLNHFDGTGNSDIAEYRDTRERSHLYFRYMRSSNPARTEASLLDRCGIGNDGTYKWNKRYERLEEVINLIDE